MNILFVIIHQYALYTLYYWVMLRLIPRKYFVIGDSIELSFFFLFFFFAIFIIVFL